MALEEASEASLATAQGALAPALRLQPGLWPRGGRGLCGFLCCLRQIYFSCLIALGPALPAQRFQLVLELLHFPLHS